MAAQKLVQDYTDAELDLHTAIDRADFNRCLAQHYADYYQNIEFWCRFASVLFSLSAFGIGLQAWAPDWRYLCGVAGAVASALQLAGDFKDRIRRCAEMAAEYRALADMYRDAWACVQLRDPKWNERYEAGRKTERVLTARFAGFPPKSKAMFAKTSAALDAAKRPA